MGNNRRKVYDTNGEIESCPKCGCRHFVRERGDRVTCRNCGEVVHDAQTNLTRRA